jgi:hypothetical protein
MITIKHHFNPKQRSIYTRARVFSADMGLSASEQGQTGTSNSPISDSDNGEGLNPKVKVGVKVPLGEVNAPPFTTQNLDSQDILRTLQYIEQTRRGTHELRDSSKPRLYGFNGEREVSATRRPLFFGAVRFLR